MSLVSRMPRYVHESTLSSMMFSIWLNLCKGVVDLETVMMLHLALQSIPQRMDHCSSMSRSFCRETWSSGLWISRYTRQSSAKRWHLVDGCRTDKRPLMYRRNRSGPSTVPCGTPEVTSELEENCPSMITLCVCPRRNDSIYVRMLPLMPYCLSFHSSLLCGTLSKALLKSRIAMPDCIPQSLMLSVSWIVTDIWVSMLKDGWYALSVEVVSYLASNHMLPELTGHSSKADWSVILRQAGRLNLSWIWVLHMLSAPIMVAHLCPLTVGIYPLAQAPGEVTVPPWNDRASGLDQLPWYG